MPLVLNRRAGDSTQAAQEVQRLLSPESLCALNGLSLEIAFLPVGEVGGDFYSCRILPGNRQRILLGDVSGKGAAAAMTAAVLLGARKGERAIILPSCSIISIRSLETCVSPGLLHAFAQKSLRKVASRLPMRATSRLINGQEVALESGLPLGISATTEYTEATLPLVRGDRLTFISDGVVEAQNTQGELFGFERTQAISARSAQEIASAAQAHGQQDDITVLTLTFAPVELLQT